MATVTKRPRAKSDLIDIWRFIAIDSPDNATRFLLTIDEKLQTIAENPFMGKAREELMEGLRSFPIGNYIIYYFPAGDGIDIVRVLNAARDISHFSDR